MAMMMYPPARRPRQTVLSAQSCHNPRLALAHGGTQVAPVPSAVTLDHRGALQVSRSTSLHLRGVHDLRRPLEILSR